nr:ATP synthase F1 subunit 4 [Polysiphonia sp.]
MSLFFNFSIFFILLISNQFFLFNEEFLIFLSFFTFYIVVHSKLSQMIQKRFYEKAEMIQLNLINSIEFNHKNLLIHQNLNKKIIKLSIKLSGLKNYYLKFSQNFFIVLLNFLIIKENQNLLNKFSNLSRFEHDCLKFVVIILIKKIQLLQLLTKFYSSTIIIKRFQTINLINKINLIKKI